MQISIDPQTRTFSAGAIASCGATTETTLQTTNAETLMAAILVIFITTSPCVDKNQVFSQWIIVVISATPLTNITHQIAICPKELDFWLQINKSVSPILLSLQFPQG